MRACAALLFLAAFVLLAGAATPRKDRAPSAGERPPQMILIF